MNDAAEGAIDPVAAEVAIDPVDVRGGAAAVAKSGGIDFGLMIYFALWYLGNYYVSLRSETADFAACRKSISQLYFFKNDSTTSRTSWP